MQQFIETAEDNRLRSFRRPRSPARIRERAGAGSALGRPDNGRDFLLHRERRVPAFGGSCEGVSSSNSHLNRPSRRLVRPALQMPGRRPPRTRRVRSDKRGCEGRLRSNLSSKLRRTGCGTRRLIFPFAIGSSDHFQASQERSQRQRRLNSSERGRSARESKPTKILCLSIRGFNRHPNWNEPPRVISSASAQVFSRPRPPCFPGGPFFLCANPF